MKLVYALVFLFSFICAQQKPLTKAEKTDYKETSTYLDVLDFIKQLQKQSADFRVINIGNTIEGKELPMLVFGKSVPKDLAGLKKDSRVIIYIQANIHAGEVEGKEAALMLARDLVQTDYKKYLNDVILLIVPNFNADGNEKFSEKSRPHQNGPKSVGIRYNSQNLDLNRDAIKLESPEIKAVMTNIFNKYDPHVFIDLHTTNGSYHAEPTAFTWANNTNGSHEIISYMRDKLCPAVSNILSGKYQTLNNFYGEFVNQRKPENGWISYAYEPRYIVNYYGLKNRLSILNENYVYADFKSRVYGVYNLLKSLIEYSAANKTEIKNLIKEADRKTVERGLNPKETDSLAISQQVVPTKVPVTIQAYELEAYKDQNGRERYKATDKVTPVTVPYLADYVPLKNVVFPYAYILSVKDPQVIENLRNHGIMLEQLTETISLEVETFKFDEIKPEARLNQGHYRNQIKGKYIKETKEFEKGTIVIRTAQPAANIVTYLLEPETEDSMLSWNFFDRYIVPQWGQGFYPYPVSKLVKKIEIKSKTF